MYSNSQDIDVKIELEENESESANSSDLQLQNTDNVVATEKNPPILNEQISSDAIDEGIIILQSPEYEQETNNNDCTFYKQNLAKQALAGVF